MVKPPERGDSSYEQYIEEKTNILDGLGRKSRIISNKLNDINGISCNIPRGAMYLFPKLELPNKDYNNQHKQSIY